MNFGKQLKEKYRKKSETQRKHTRMPPVKGGSRCRRGKPWKGYSMCCEPAANGRHCLVNMEAAVRCTEGFRNGWRPVFFEKIWSKGLEQYDELEGIGWEWQSLDGCMVKAPLALESVGKNPTDRGKNGDKTQCFGG